MENKEMEKNDSQKWEKPIVRNIVTGAVILVIVIIGFIVVLNKDSKIDRLSTEKNNLSLLIERRDSVINELDRTISEIERNLTFIKEKRGQLEFDQQEGNPDKQQNIIEDIALMNTMLEESEKKLEELNSKLASSNVEIKSFRNRVAKLTQDMEEQNQVIVQLQEELENKNSQIAEMDMHVNTLESNIEVMNDSMSAMSHSIIRSTEKIQQLDQDLHKAYWAFGTFKELKENGVVIREGGLLGILGTNKTLKTDINEKYFTESDIRNLKTIPINAKKAEVISDHTQGSYRFVYEDDLIAYLEIADPNEFWKYTKYAVIEIK